MKKIFLLFALAAFVSATTVTPVLAANDAIVFCDKCTDKDKKADKGKKKCAKGEKKGCCSAKSADATKGDAEKPKCHTKTADKAETTTPVDEVK